jgi:hypothetical protein
LLKKATILEYFLVCSYRGAEVACSRLRDAAAVADLVLGKFLLKQKLVHFTLLRLVGVSEDRMGHKLWMASENLPSVRHEFVDDLGFWS